MEYSFCEYRTFLVLFALKMPYDLSKIGQVLVGQLLSRYLRHAGRSALFHLDLWILRIKLLRAQTPQFGCNSRPPRGEELVLVRLTYCKNVAD